MSWPPTRNILDQLLNDYYDYSIPEWRNPAAKADVTDLERLFEDQLHDDREYKKRSRFYKYLPLLVQLYEQKPTWQHVAPLVTDGDSALAMVILVDQLARWLAPTEIDGGGSKLVYSDSLNQALFLHHVLPREYDDDRAFGGKRNAAVQILFHTVLLHAEDLAIQQLALERIRAQLVVVSDAQRRIPLWSLELAKRHCWYILHFGRYPYWNDSRGRVWTEKERRWRAGGDGLPSYYPNPFKDPLPPSKEEDEILG